jgi:hypothetical protein
MVECNVCGETITVLRDHDVKSGIIECNKLVK